MYNTRQTKYEKCLDIEVEQMKVTEAVLVDPWWVPQNDFYADFKPTFHFCTETSSKTMFSSWCV